MIKAKPTRNNAALRWHGTISADHVKAAVASWARERGMLTLHEVGNLVDGRLDAVMIPLGVDAPIFVGMREPGVWNVEWTKRCGLAGVEVKVDKQDFKRGLESGQFERYAKDLSGLYVAGPPNVVDAKLVPKQHGVLLVGRSQNGAATVVCRRHPQWQRVAFDESQAWRLVWAMAKTVRINEYRQRDKLETVERIAGKVLGKAVRELYDERLRGAKLTSEPKINTSPNDG